MCSLFNLRRLGLCYGYLSPLSQCYRYIVALLVEKAGVPEETPPINLTDKLYHLILCRLQLAVGGNQIYNVSESLALIAKVEINPTTIRTSPLQPLHLHR